MAARRPFWKWQRWKSIGFCLWPPSTCIWNLKLKFQSKLDLCSGNHVVYRQTDRRTDGQTDGRTDKVNPVYPPSNFVGRGYKNWDSHSLVNGYPSFYPRIALVAPSPGGGNGASLVSLNFDSYSALVNAMLYEILCCIGLCYNGNLLYIELHGLLFIINFGHEWDNSPTIFVK